MNQSWEERLQKEQDKTAALLAEKEAVEAKKEVVPYMWNLAEDPALTGARLRVWSSKAWVRVRFWKTLW